jgi:hypothetical protein
MATESPSDFAGKRDLRLLPCSERAILPPPKRSCKSFLISCAMPVGVRQSDNVQMRWQLFMLERNLAAAQKALVEFPAEEFPHPEVELKRSSLPAWHRHRVTSQRPGNCSKRRDHFSKGTLEIIPMIRHSWLRSDWFCLFRSKRGRAARKLSRSRALSEKQRCDPKPKLLEQSRAGLCADGRNGAGRHSPGNVC